MCYNVIKRWCVTLIKIGIIVPEDTVIEAKLAAKEFKENINVFQASIDEALELTKELIENNYDIILARGVTQVLLQSSNLNIPVLNIPITAIDIFEAVREAEKISNDVSLLVSENMISPVEDYMKISARQLKFFQVKNELEINQKLKDFQNDKTKVVVGLGALTKLAPLYGLKSVTIKSGLEILVRTIKEAKRIAIATSKEKNDNQRIKAIVENLYDGIIGVDRYGYITLFNDSARKLLKCQSEKIIGKKIESILPDIELNETLNFGIKETSVIINLKGKKFMVSRIPIKVNNQVVNAVAIIRDIDEIQKEEEKIRLDTIGAGHYAKYTFKDIIGCSNTMKETIRIGKEYAKVEATILIEGETGTGKEVFAQSIHNYSTRSSGPFVAVNCAALPESLLESELFGYDSGAFTGADRRGKRGLFELAHKGTIFLDEISEMDFKMQGRLLRVLQEKQVMRLGSNKITPISIRVIVATNKSLQALVRSGKFREDLYYRLDVLRIDLLPLRDRMEDISYLLNYFIKECCNKFGKNTMTFSLEAMKYLSNYTWSGNVREIRNFCERLSITINKSEISLEDVRKHIKHHPNTSTETEYEKVELNRNTLINNEEELRYPLNISNMEKINIKRALVRYNGNMTDTAKGLGISRTTLWRKMKKYGIQVL